MSAATATIAATATTTGVPVVTVEAAAATMAAVEAATPVATGQVEAIAIVVRTEHWKGWTIA